MRRLLGTGSKLVLALLVVLVTFLQVIAGPAAIAEQAEDYGVDVADPFEDDDHPQFSRAEEPPDAKMRRDTLDPAEFQGYERVLPLAYGLAKERITTGSPGIRLIRSSYARGPPLSC